MERMGRGKECTCGFPIVPRSVRNFPEYDVINGGGGGYTRGFPILARDLRKGGLRKDVKHVNVKEYVSRRDHYTWDPQYHYMNKMHWCRFSP